MKIWTPKEGDIYMFDGVLVGKYNSIVIDKVIGFVKPQQTTYNSRSGNDYDYGLLFSFNLEGISDTLYCKAENFQDFKEAIDPQTTNVTNKTMREIKLEKALRDIVNYKAQYGIIGIPAQFEYVREIAREALKVTL